MCCESTSLFIVGGICVVSLQVFLLQEEYVILTTDQTNPVTNQLTTDQPMHYFS